MFEATRQSKKKALKHHETTYNRDNPYVTTYSSTNINSNYNNENDYDNWGETDLFSSSMEYGDGPYPLDPLNIRHRKRKNVKLSLNRKNKCYNRTCGVLFSLIIICTLGMQAICLFYLISMGEAIKSLKLDGINVTNAEIYINKTEALIDYACSNIIKC